MASIALEPHFEEDEEFEEEEEEEEENSEDIVDNPNQVPESRSALILNSLSDQQSYQLYVVQAPGKAAGPDLEDANIDVLNAGADDNLLSEDDQEQIVSSASDDPLRRRRVRIDLLIS